MDFASQVVIVKGLFVKSRNCFGVTVNLLHQFLNWHPLANTFVVGDLHTPLVSPRMDDRRHTVALSGGGGTGHAAASAPEALATRAIPASGERLPVIGLGTTSAHSSARPPDQFSGWRVRADAG